MSADTDPTKVTDPTSATETKPAPKNKGGRPRIHPKKEPAKAPAKGPGRPSNDQKLAESVAGQLNALGMGLAAVGVATKQPAVGLDGAAVMEHSEPIAEALVEVAKQNPKVRKFLESGVESSAWLGVVIAVGALAKDIAGNHMIDTTATEAPKAPSSFDRLGEQAQAARAGG